jgi:spore germination protein YaaH
LCYIFFVTIDERLEFLRQSTESLHASCQELHATVAAQAEEHKRLDARERRSRQAIGAAIAAYIEALDEDDDNGTP